METNLVKVKSWGIDVGYLSWDIAPLTMPIDSVRSQKQIPWIGDKNKLYHGLPTMIADSLPDKWGNSLFKAWLRDNNISTKKITSVDHLSFIGSR